MSPNSKSLKNGEFDEDAVRKVAPHLNLDADSLVVSGQKGWRPEPIEVEGLSQFNTEFEDMTVNAYLVWDPATKKAAAFDSGADASALAEKIRAGGLDLVATFLDPHPPGSHRRPRRFQIRRPGRPALRQQARTPRRS